MESHTTKHDNSLSDENKESQKASNTKLKTVLATGIAGVAASAGGNAVKNTVDDITETDELPTLEEAFPSTEDIASQKDNKVTSDESDISINDKLESDDDPYSEPTALDDPQDIQIKEHQPISIHEQIDDIDEMLIAENPHDSDLIATDGEVVIEDGPYNYDETDLVLDGIDYEPSINPAMRIEEIIDYDPNAVIRYDNDLTLEGPDILDI